MKKRGIQVFIALTLVLCLLTLSFPTGVTATVKGINGSATPETYDEEPVLDHIEITPGEATIMK